MLGGAGGPDALQTSSEGVRRYRSGNFRLLRCALGREAECELPREFDARRSWRAGRPPDLFGGSRTVPRREFPTPVVRGREEGGNAELLRENNGEGSWRARRPPDLLAREKAKPCCQLLRTRPCGPYLSGSARLRSTASQSLLAALRSAKQFSHMRSRRSPRLCP